MKFKFSSRELILFIILIFVGLGVIFYQYFYMPLQNERKNLLQEKELKTEELSKLKAKGAKTKEGTASIDSLQGEIDTIAKKIPEVKDIPGILSEIYGLTVENNVDGSDIFISDTKEAEKYNYFNLSFEATGSRQNIFGLIKALENFSREVAIDRIDFSPKGEDLLKTGISMKVYMLKSKDGAPEPAGGTLTGGTYEKHKNTYDIFSGDSGEKTGNGDLKDAGDKQSKSGQGENEEDSGSSIEEGMDDYSGNSGTWDESDSDDDTVQTGNGEDSVQAGTGESAGTAEGSDLDGGANP